MTNAEKYKEKIKKAFKENEYCGIRQLIYHTDNCESMTCYECKKGIIEWLLSECKEPEVDWSKIKVDTPILVSDDGVMWKNRYFAKYKDGKVFYFYGGKTSWSNNGFMLCSCPYAKLAEENEK